MEIDITRDTFTALKSTAWKDFETRLNTFGLYHPRHHNKTDHVYELKGNLISYYGADNPDKIHGRSRDILWVNEAHQFPVETIDQLFPRTRHRIICDYNPALGLEHWLDPYIEQFPPLITTYKDNPHLTPAQVADIESRRGNRYWWSVYGCGERANAEGVIFENWEVGDFDTSLPVIYGQDFGFAKDPTTLVKIAIDEKRKTIYCDELLYATDLTTDAIAEINRTHAGGNGLIVADSAEPRLITELRAKHKLNVVGAIKGPNSVQQGVFLLQNYRLIITPTSVNLKRELSRYCWSDKRGGVPVDDFNHAIDAIRYAHGYHNHNPNRGRYVF
jgi:phage terminase large subunit